MTNQKRCSRRIAGEVRKYRGSVCVEDTATAVTDILADLRHYCDNRELDFAELDGTAHGHYLEELEDDCVLLVGRGKSAKAKRRRKP